MIWAKEETLPRDEIEAIQFAKLKGTVRYIYDRVKPYREKMDAAGIKPEDIEIYMKAGADGFGVGGNLVPLDLMKKGEFDRITEIARRYTKEIARCRKM